MSTAPPLITKNFRTFTGTVLRAGHIPRCARVLHRYQTYDKYLHKYFPASSVHLVSDPNNSLRDGDVIQFRSGWRVASNVRHVVQRIIAPFGTSVEERPPVMGDEEREAWMRTRREERRKRKGGGKGRDPPRPGKMKARVLGRLRRMEEEMEMRRREKEEDTATATEVRKVAVVSDQSGGGGGGGESVVEERRSDVEVEELGEKMDNARI